MATRCWNLLHMLRPEHDTKIALLLVNQPLQDEAEIFFTLWRKALFKASVDGGTNQLYDNTDGKREDFLPDLISGDFDSARPEVLQFYREKGVEVVETMDQDYCDLHKSLDLVVKKGIHLQVDCIVIFGGFGGRVDQIFANINNLFTHGSIVNVPIYLMNHHSLACLLQKGSHRLQVDSGFEGEYCGLIPIAGKCENITTTGLKWNLDHQAMCFGELVSTSNTWNGDKVVTIETDGPLLWTMTMKEDKT